jgi:hypothetical protein
MESASIPEIAELKEHFKNKPIFAEVINALLKLDQGKSL